MGKVTYEQVKEHRRRRRAAGLCAVCCRPSATYRCKDCTTKTTKFTNKWRATRCLTENRCLMCGRERPEWRTNHKTCGWCSETKDRLRRTGW